MKAAPQLQRQLATWIMSDLSFSSNDVTVDGTVTLDAGHKANAINNGIGALFNEASRRKLIEWTGNIEASTAPHRKGGMVRLWHGTEAGRLWARNVLRLDDDDISGVSPLVRGRLPES